MSAANTIDMRGFNRMLGFDQETGQLITEAGVLLSDIIDVFLPRGWFPWVTPGTRFVTVGGMIAADVHGKNHHRHGSFGAFVDWIDIMGPDGKVSRCAPDQNSELFQWTLGGMGLTGVILRAAFRLRRVETGWISQRTIPTQDLNSTLAVFEAQQDATYSVAWIDCLSRDASLGRSLVTLGEHATASDLLPAQREAPFATPRRRRLSIPLDAPGFLLNRRSMQAFNQTYYSRGSQNAGESLSSWESFFYPLDAVLNWNRMYGRKGFAQFQCVLPLARSADGLRLLLQAISTAGLGSFLAVLKRLGPQGTGLSFPMEGYTLALDFPVRPTTMALLRKLDEIVLAHGGRFYLAKDSRLVPDTLRVADLRTEAFVEMRKTLGLHRRFTSFQSERLYL